MKNKFIELFASRNKDPKQTKHADQNGQGVVEKPGTRVDTAASVVKGRRMLTISRNPESCRLQVPDLHGHGVVLLDAATKVPKCVRLASVQALSNTSMLPA